MRPSYTLGGNVHWYSHHGKQCGDCFKSWEFDPAIPLLSTHTKETRNERDTCTPMFIATLFTIARTWKQTRYPWTDEWIKKLWYTYVHIMEYSVQSLSRVQLFVTPWTGACQAPCSSPTLRACSHSCPSSL